MSAEQSVSSGENVLRFDQRATMLFPVFRWLFIIGLVSMALRILGLWGNSDIAGVVNAVQGNDLGTIMNDILIDGVLIAVLFYAILSPRRPVFVLGASMIFFIHWLGVVLVATGISRVSLADQLSFMKGVMTLSGVLVIIESILPLAGFLAFPPSTNVPKERGRGAMKLVEIAVPVVAGFLLAVVPTQHFTGSTPLNSTNLQGFVIQLFIAGGILAAISGIIRNPNVNLFWGVMMFMTLLETWIGVTHLQGATRPSLWPGIGMIVGIIGCVFLLFSKRVARLVTRWLFARRPVITEST